MQGMQGHVISGEMKDRIEKLTQDLKGRDEQIELFRKLFGVIEQKWPNSFKELKAKLEEKETAEKAGNNANSSATVTEVRPSDNGEERTLLQKLAGLITSLEDTAQIRDIAAVVEQTGQRGLTRVLNTVVAYVTLGNIFGVNLPKEVASRLDALKGTPLEASLTGTARVARNVAGAAGNVAAPVARRAGNVLGAATERLLRGTAQMAQKKGWDR